MRILLLSNRVPWPLTDGGAIAMFNMLKGFHSQGHEVHLLCLNTSKHYVKKEELPAIFHDIASFEAEHIDTDVTAFGALMNLFSRKSYHISRFWSAAFAAKLEQKLKGTTFDVIQLELLHMALYLDVIRNNSKAFVSLRAHNVEHLIWERMAEAEKGVLKKWYVSLLAKRLKRYELEMMNRFDALIPITGQDADYFRKAGCHIPVHVSPTGLDIDEYKIDQSRMEWPAVFHLGALNWMPNRQGLDWFLEYVWPIIHVKYPGLYFYIAGRGMESWTPAAGLPNVKLVGEVENAREFLNSKAIMIVPLLSGSGMRIKIIEGMAMGKAIVSTAIGAEGIGAKNDENILVADTPQAFAEAIGKLLDDKEGMLSLGRAARSFAEANFSNEAITRRLIGFYESSL